MSDPFPPYLAALRARFAATATGPLFTTDATGLFDAWLAGLREEDRQLHTCGACRRFVTRYGGLVALTERGRAVSVLWDPGSVPEPYRAAVDAVARRVSEASITGIFLTSRDTWGVAGTGPWRHMAIEPPASRVHRGGNAGQVAAEKREDRAALARAVADFPAEVVDRAIALLRAEALDRSEKCLGVATWFAGVHAARGSDNLLWRAAATAPPGYCHVRSTLIGTLLEDLAAGLPYEDVRRRFDAKVDARIYQRPQAPPSAGNIAVAEKIVAELGSAGALARRYARLDDVVTLWRPEARGGVFGAVAPKSKAGVADMPPVVVTWEKLARTVLPDARAIDCRTPEKKGPFYAFVTAANPDAPPILQWDRPDRRNPVSWYTWPEESTAAEWELAAGSWYPVTAVCLFPHMWHGGGFDHHGAGVLFVLEGARDTRVAGAALFPELLRGEYHGSRSTIEAYSNKTKLAGRDDAEACGLGIRKGRPMDVLVRVTRHGGPAVTYRLDRWD